MNPSRNLSVLVIRITLLLLFTLVVTACPGERPPEQNVQNTGIQTPPPPDDGDEGDPVITWSSAPAPDPDEVKYKVDLTAERKMRVGDDHYFRVWIGGEDSMPPPMEDTVSDTTTVMAHEGSYAVITPVCPKFKVSPDTPQTLPLKASGSSILFTLTPLKRGKSYVSAIVKIYDREGNETPQSTNRLSVKISSGFWVRQGDHAAEMENVFWEKFIPFFSALLVLVLGAILFVVRRYIKKKTGYDGDGNDQLPTSKE